MPAVNDATIFSLGSTILPALSHADQANRLFVDHVTLAAGIHLAQTYGGLRPVVRPVRGGLAPWQERRAKEILSANLDGGVPLNDVARECRLSVSHFSRAFRRSMGVAPHNWLLTRRIEVAKEKLRYSSIVALGGGVGLRLRRSKPPDPGVHRHGRRQSGRLASGAGRIASGRIAQ